MAASTCGVRSGVARLSMKTRTGPSYLRMRSTPPATWNSAPKVTLKKPSMISASVKFLRSIGAAVGDLGIFGRSDGAGQAVMRGQTDAGRSRLACAASRLAICERAAEAVERHGFVL